MQANAGIAPNPPEQSDSSDKCTFVVVAPRKVIASDFVSQKTLELQAKEKAAWKGLDIDYIGRVGNGALNVDRKLKFAESDKTRELDDKSHALLELLNRYSMAEEYKLRILNNKYSYSLIRFRPVTESEVPKEESPLVPYAKPATGDSNVLLYKITKGDSAIVRWVLDGNGFRYTDNHSWNLLWTSSHVKPYLYEGLNEYQKVNHFPGSVEMTRKDRMCDNIVQRQQKYGKAAFNIIPDTYVLPDEFADFYAHFHELRKSGESNIWILKPNALSRGRGIHLVTDTDSVPIDEPCVISRYIHNPLLINSLKFDLRIYVVLTSLDPLRIYVYNEGLARFCTEKYDASAKDNRFSHLTNYSVNKKNEKFVSNKRADIDDFGQKWSLTALNKFLEKHGVDVPLLWSKIYDLIIRTFVACEPAMQPTYKKTAVHRSNCFELFGFDVLLDEDLKPWLMEVNLSPSLACESPLDHQVKSNLIADLLTLLGIRQFDRRKDGAYRGRTTQAPMVGKKRITLKGKSVERAGDEELKGGFKRLAQVPPKYREILLDTLEEYERRRNFVRVYPAKGTDFYDSLFEVTRTTHKIIYRYLYGTEALLSEKELPQGPVMLPSIPLPMEQKLSLPRDYTTTATKEPTYRRESERSIPLSSAATQMKEQTGKILITGDDILIEYVARLVLALKTIKDAALKPGWVRAVERFVTHEVWQCSGDNKGGEMGERRLRLWQRLEAKLVEMKDRRRKMLRTGAAAGKSNQEFETDYGKEQERKQAIIQAFSVAQLEDMLRSSTRNVAYEVVNCLIPCASPGILFNIVTWLSTFKHSLITSEQYLILDQKSSAEVQQKSSDVEDEPITSLGSKTLPDPERRSKTKLYLTPINVRQPNQCGGITASSSSNNAVPSPTSASRISSKHIEAGASADIVGRPHRLYKPLLIGTKHEEESPNQSALGDSKAEF